MVRIFSIFLVFISLCSIAQGQGDRRMVLTNSAGVADVSSIPLSDALVEKLKRPGETLKKSERELPATVSDSSTGLEKKRYWVNAEYLNWHIKGSYLPPLAQGVIFSPFTVSTVITYGDEVVNPGNSGGGRVTSGLWLNRRRTVGIEASYFYLGPRSVSQSVGNLSSDLLSSSFVLSFIRPYTSARPGHPIYGFSPDISGRGNLTYSLASHLQGAEVNSVYDLGEKRCCRLLGGFRFFDLKERFTVIDSHVVNPLERDITLLDRSFYITDEFATRNRFYGGQGGVQTEFSRGKLRLELSGKVAIGGVRQLVNINGSTHTETSYPFSKYTNVTVVGGFLALESNIGRYERTRFGVLSEAKAGVGYQLTDNLEAFAGYDFLHIYRVARTAEQLDTTIDWVHVPYFFILDQEFAPSIPPRPAFGFRDSTFWAQGLIIGVRERF